VSGNVPLPLPSPPPSADDSVLNKPDVQRKILSPEKPSIPCKEEANHPTPLPPVETLLPAGHESDFAPPSPTDSSSFNHHPTNNYLDSNGGLRPASNDGTFELDLSCSGSCDSEHGNNEVPSTKANPQDSPISGKMCFPTQSWRVSCD